MSLSPRLALQRRLEPRRTSHRIVVDRYAKPGVFSHRFRDLPRLDSNAIQFARPRRRQYAARLLLLRLFLLGLLRPLRLHAVTFCVLLLRVHGSIVHVSSLPVFKLKPLPQRRWILKLLIKAKNSGVKII